MEAGLIDPHAIVFFATDGIVSTRELIGVRRSGENIELGDWELYDGDGGLFIQAGVYHYGKVKIGKDGKRRIEPVTKLRGATAKNYTDDERGAGAWLIENTLARWRAPFSTSGSTLGVSEPYKKYITAGTALASPDRWRLAGRWTPKRGHPNAAHRIINVSDPGGKRELLDYAPDVLSTDDRPANRCTMLVRTIPVENDDREMSRPREPKWLDQSREETDAAEIAEINAGFA